ncbi:hypothetical protein A2303_02500 [Candidatus Falkowbacteria bacterium RIFOXYB2_FULL_47_14]|uniref:Uncharacterized protein n=1 Tax=Candidatus Falkowbacteria bacterium RIFOXYA2_FULL_47_19 TaxID=1797994 RepID=A0A1F5SJL7_9BACT|nr:MAG: hypothetical protein A2227_06370 [Candidatus Falkowbacteria bacterium RIFOXYA2_FULL_47_19]OGF35932.1 MAG: hypothetical protein A2468_01825 [Candidatus Falkowbacteria bacterium RIFOXYC2_FULL_46_15]OGF43930.1 MAG: hypothetical protein A2303_02500 [Candidatus Falkowbacteria bacterium RIFOXYB2_FULL_47_14]
MIEGKFDHLITDNKREEERMEFKDAADFEKNCRQNPVGAEEWMNRVFASDPRYKDNERWLEDRQRTLLGVYCETGDKESAARIVAATRQSLSQQGRIKKYEKFFGEYSLQRLEMRYGSKEKSEVPVIDSATFRQALLEGRLDEAETWLNAPATLEKYRDYPNVLSDRRRELNDARAKIG